MPPTSECLQFANGSFVRPVTAKQKEESVAKELRPSRPQEVSPSFALLQDGAGAPHCVWVIPLLLQLLPPTLAASGRVAYACNPFPLTMSHTQRS